MTHHVRRKLSRPRTMLLFILLCKDYHDFLSENNFLGTQNHLPFNLLFIFYLWTLSVTEFGIAMTGIWQKCDACHFHKTRLSLYTVASENLKRSWWLHLRFTYFEILHRIKGLVCQFFSHKYIFFCSCEMSEIIRLVGISMYKWDNSRVLWCILV